MWTIVKDSQVFKHHCICLLKISIQILSPFSVRKLSSLLGSLSTRFWIVTVWIYSTTKTLVRSGTDAGWGGLGCNQCYCSFWKCSVELRSGLRAGHLGSSTLPCLHRGWFANRGFSCWSRFASFLLSQITILQ